MTKTTTEEFFTEDEALNNILSFLEDGTTDYCVSDLQDYIFNQDYYIIYNSTAVKALSQYGTWNALAEVKEYEENEFGEVNTDLANAVDVANMLEFIIGDRVVNYLKSVNDYIDYDLNDEADEEGKTVRQVIIDEVNSWIKELQ